MKCPACHNEMQLLDSGKVVVDACVGHCGGVWFDNFELKQVDEEHETTGEAFLDIPRDPDLKVDMRSKRKCPVCETITLRRHFFSVKRKIEVDECGQCGGIWLDADELRRIRGEFVDEAARIDAAEDEFARTFDKELDSMRKESDEMVARANKFASMFRAILPSTYIPGAQGGQSVKRMK
jgi:Zn-finger nucleic acid-binding protein